MRQHTIRKPVSIEGVGLHSGKVARVTVSPAPRDAGIVFKVRATGERIPARPESVVNAHYATTLGLNAARIQTVEHLMAAAAGLGIDNVEIEVDGPEIPALDGSAKPFVALLAFAGREQQSARRRMLSLPCPLRVGSAGRWFPIVPSDTWRFTYTLGNAHPALGTRFSALAGWSGGPRRPSPRRQPTGRRETPHGAKTSCRRPVSSRFSPRFERLAVSDLPRLSRFCHAIIARPPYACLVVPEPFRCGGAGAGCRRAGAR